MTDTSISPAPATAPIQTSSPAPSDGRHFVGGIAGAIVFVLVNAFLAWLIALGVGMIVIAAQDWFGLSLAGMFATFQFLAVAWMMFLAVRGGAKAGHAVATAIAPDFSMGAAQRLFGVILLGSLAAAYFVGVYDLFELLPMALGGFAAVFKGEF